jgi:hypothetical protein
MENEENLNAVIPSSFQPAAALDAFGKLMDYARELTITDREKTRYSAARDVMITDITHKYEFYHELLVATFIERSKSIDKYFEIIDDGIKKDYNERINMGLKYLTDFVKETPFKNIQNIIDSQQRRNMLESGELSIM